MTAYVLTAIQYAVFLMFLTLGAMQAYAAVYSKEERRFLKNRIRRKMNQQKELSLQRSAKSKITSLFKEASVPWVTSIRYILIRFTIFIMLEFYLILAFSEKAALVSGLIYLLSTEPYLKFSLVRLYLVHRKKKIREKKEGELYSLFAMLKTDLLGSSQEQVNAYHVVKESLPYLRHIKPILHQFMRNWRESPEVAGRKFEEELGGETAQFMGDFLGSLHNMNRNNALHILEEQNEVFGHRRSEMLLQKAEKEKNFYFMFFFATSMLIFIWFILFVSEITNMNTNF